MKDNTINKAKKNNVEDRKCERCKKTGGFLVAFGGEPPMCSSCLKKQLIGENFDAQKEFKKAARKLNKGGV